MVVAQRDTGGLMDAREHLSKLVGRTIHTLTGRPNRILAIEGDSVIVATQRSPAGTPVPLHSVQDAMDLLREQGELEISVETVGYRSAFIGAVLLTLPGARGGTGPARVVLSGSTEASSAAPIVIYESLHIPGGDTLRENTTPLPLDIGPEQILQWLQERHGPPVSLALNETGVPTGFVFEGPEVEEAAGELTSLIAIPYTPGPAGEEIELYELVAQARTEVASGVRPPEDLVASAPLPDELWAMAPSTVRDWSEFEEALETTLSSLGEDSSLLLMKKNTRRFIQFIQGGSKGFRIEAASNVMLNDVDKLPAEDSYADLGWIPPASPGVSKGDTTYYRVWPRPASFEAIANLTVRTLQQVLKVRYPSDLEYEAFSKDGGYFYVAPLGISPMVRRDTESTGPQLLDADPSVLEVNALAEAAVSQLTSHPVQRDDDGDLGIRVGSTMLFVRTMAWEPPGVRIFAPLLLGAEVSEELLDVLNEINKQLVFGRVVLHESEITLSAELTGLFLSREGLIEVCVYLAKAANHFDDLLQQRFGGSRLFDDPRERPQAHVPGYL
jgi:hypothetical protein